MDRLICGDVGFGKTEVALRAIFCVVSAGRQAMVLAPTIVLAKQHFDVISERFSKYPSTKVGLLSRFQVREVYSLDWPHSLTKNGITCLKSYLNLRKSAGLGVGRVQVDMLSTPEHFKSPLLSIWGVSIFPNKQIIATECVMILCWHSLSESVKTCAGLLSLLL